MVKQLTLAMAVVATLGLTTVPSTGSVISTASFETLSTFATGAVLWLVAVAARRAPTAKR